MTAPASPTLSPAQLESLAVLGEERTARVGDVLYRVVDRRYPLSEIVAALRWMSDGHAKGKVVITDSPEP